MPTAPFTRCDSGTMIWKRASITDPEVKDNGARKVLVPTENKRQFLEVDSEIMEHVDPVFYGDIRAALMKALEIS